LASREAQKGERPAPDRASPPTPVIDPELVDLAGAAPKVGARPSQSRRGGRRRPSGAKRR
jgi:hypothetical protein